MGCFGAPFCPDTENLWLSTVWTHHRSSLQWSFPVRGFHLSTDAEGHLGRSCSCRLGIRGKIGDSWITLKHRGDCFVLFFFRKNGCLLALRYESCFNPVTYYKPPLTPPFLSGICLCFHLSPDCLILDSCHRLCGIIISSMWWFSLSVSNISVRKQSHMSIKKQPCYAMLVYRDAATMR